MAYERLSDKKVIATNLGTYISSQILLISKARTRRNLEDEAIFTRSVLEDNLTLDQQLKYRNDQLGRVVSGDKDEKRRIKNEISTVKDLIEQKKFSDAYLKQVMFLNSGMQSIDTTINWLNKKLEQTTDIKIKQDVKENISKLKGMRYQKRQNALSSQTDYANKDKTPKIVQDQIERINNERTSASLAGNEDYVTLLDLQLQSLNKTNEEAMVSRAILDFSVATMTGQSALGTLNELNTKVSGANELSPINIGGVQYDSAKQFWEMKRGDYLNDRTDNGFFARYQGELSDQVTYKQSRGILSTESLSEVKAFYETIKNRPELTDYQDRIAQEQQVALQSTADLRAQSILNEFAVKLDAKKAISDISAIQDTYGVDQTLNYQKIISSAAKEKESQVREILSTMQQDMANTPGLSQQQ